MDPGHKPLEAKVLTRQVKDPPLASLLHRRLADGIFCTLLGTHVLQRSSSPTGGEPGLGQLVVSTFLLLVTILGKESQANKVPFPLDIGECGYDHWLILVIL